MGGEVRVALLALAMTGLIAGCSDDKPEAATAKTISEQALEKDCANPRWKEQNLGLWYSVCRKSINW